MQKKIGTRYLLTLALLLSFAAISALAQDIDAPSIGLFAGAGAQGGSPWTGALQAGASFDQSAPNHWIGYMFEGGYIGPFSGRGAGSAIFSGNYMTSWNSKRSPKLFPYATVGYTHLFGTGNAVNFGAGIDFRLNPKVGIRLEGRDYLSFSPNQHNFAIRIGVRHYVED